MKPPTFRSRLRPLSIVDYERMSPAALERRAALEQQERREWDEAQKHVAARQAPRQKTVN
jgi:hypothetical protein